MATVVHEPWCEGHIDDPLDCTYVVPQFGTLMTDGRGETYPRGALYVHRNAEDPQPMLCIEYCTDRTRRIGSVLMSAEVALVLLAAFEDAPEDTIKSLSAALDRIAPQDATA